MERLKPSQVVRASQLMWVLWGLGSAYLTMALLALIVRADPVAVPLGVAYLIVIVAIAILVRAVAAGKSWARIVYATFACISILSSVVQLAVSSGSPILQSVISFVLIGVYIWILCLLFHPRAKPWFKRSATVGPN